MDDVFVPEARGKMDVMDLVDVVDVFYVVDVIDEFNKPTQTLKHKRL